MIFRPEDDQQRFSHPVTDKIPVELLLQQMSIGSSETLPEMLCTILANSGKINSNCNRAKKAQAYTQGMEEPTAQRETSKPSQNPYS